MPKAKVTKRVPPRPKPKTAEEKARIEIETKGILSANLKQLVIEFVKNLENLFSEPEDRIDLHKIQLYFGNESELKIMQHVVSHILPYKTQIVDRDESYILDKRNQLFASFPEPKVEYIARLLRLPVGE